MPRHGLSIGGRRRPPIEERHYIPGNVCAGATAVARAAVDAAARGVRASWRPEHASWSQRRRLGEPIARVVVRRARRRARVDAARQRARRERTADARAASATPRVVACTGEGAPNAAHGSDVLEASRLRPWRRDRGVSSWLSRIDEEQAESAPAAACPSSREFAREVDRRSGGVKRAHLNATAPARRNSRQRRARTSDVGRLRSPGSRRMKHVVEVRKDQVEKYAEVGSAAGARGSGQRAGTCRHGVVFSCSRNISRAVVSR